MSLTSSLDRSGTVPFRESVPAKAAAAGLRDGRAASIPADSRRHTDRAGRDAGATVVELRGFARPTEVSAAGGSVRALRPRDPQPKPEDIPRRAGVAAFANRDAPAGDRPGIETGTEVMTQAGPVPVERLRPGAVVLTDSGLPAIVRRVEAREAATDGATAAVRLRAPYFGLTRDLCVSRHTGIMLSGPEVEYAFGSDRVIAAAGDLVNGDTIVSDLNEPVREFHIVELDRPGCLTVGRCRVAGAEAAAGMHERIDRASARSVLSMLPDPRGLIG